MTPDTRLGCDAWWSDPGWERADTSEQKRCFVLGKLHAFNRERLMDVMYDRYRDRRAREEDEARCAETLEVGNLPSSNVQEDLPSANSEVDDLLFMSQLPFFDPITHYTPEDWQSVLDQMGASVSEVRDVLVRLGFER